MHIPNHTETEAVDRNICALDVPKSSHLHRVLVSQCPDWHEGWEREGGGWGDLNPSISPIATPLHFTTCVQCTFTLLTQKRRTEGSSLKLVFQ